MSIALTRRIKDLEEAVRKLDERILHLEMQKQPVMVVAQQLIDSDLLESKPTGFRKTLTLRGKAA